MVYNKKQIMTELMLNNLPRCVHCYNNVCSAEHMMSEMAQPIFMETEDKTKMIDINILVTKLPHEILIKIYTEYIRPHKFAQLFTILTTNSVYTNETYERNITQFVKHFKIFVYSPIRKYITRTDQDFNQVMTSLANRNYSSAFTRITNMKTSVFIEILMVKYH